MTVTVINLEPPVTIVPQTRPQLVLAADRAPVVIVPQERRTFHITQIPGVGPAGPAGAQGPAGEAGAIDTVARDAISLHVIDPTPHPVYDDMPDLILIYENGII